MSGFDPQPLSGVRIVDFTWAGVGPYCTFLCSLMGAEVIKPETAAHPTIFRGVRPSGDSERAEKGTRWFSLDELYVNKKGVRLNLKHPEGVALAKRIIAVSDAVAENFQAGVFERLGFGYDDLRALSPALVLLSASAHGATGPERHGKGLAQAFSALGGPGYLTGYEDGPPVELRLPVDLISGTASSFALLTALWNARQSGQGCHIDAASREVMTSFIGEAVLDAVVNKRDQPRMGNRDPHMAPHGVYPCKGDDQWLSIAVGTDEEWRALCAALDRPDWPADPRFATEPARHAHQPELDAEIAAWTAPRDKIEAMNDLQAAGVPATASYSAADLLADPHLQDRGVFEITEDVAGNPLLLMGAPWKFSRTPGRIDRRPPKTGEDDEYVYGELLGIGSRELRDLEARGVVA